MTTEEAILDVLLGKKILDGNVWRVFNGADVEITQAGGVLWRGGTHGAMLWGQPEAGGNPYRGFLLNHGKLLGQP